MICYLRLIILNIILFALTGCQSPASNAFKVEHIALDVESPEKTANWWCENLGFQIAVKQTAPPYAIFIRQADGQFAIELYRSARLPAPPDYRAQDPDQLHLAFISKNLNADISRLTGNGATLVTKISNNGSELAMLRDPSGIPIQLVQRRNPILKEQQ